MPGTDTWLDRAQNRRRVPREAGAGEMATAGRGPGRHQTRENKEEEVDSNLKTPRIETTFEYWNKQQQLFQAQLYRENQSIFQEMKKRNH